MANRAAQKSNRMALALVLAAGGMLGLAYASVPLYDLFCRVTGYGGTTQEAEIAPDIILDREMRIDFDANTNRNMPWEFKPTAATVTLKVGQTGMAYYEAYNPTDRTITGTATYNVTPLKVGEYFTKMECFCFTEQTLAPGERVSMPVSFFVDPSIEEDPNAKDVRVITLSYTFFIKDGKNENVKLSEAKSSGVNKVSVN